MPIKRKKRTKPPAPPDGDQYVLVKTREGSFWRKKRGLVRPAKLNEAFAKNVKLTTLASPAAKKIQVKLHPFLRGLDTGRFIARLSSKLKEYFNKTGKLDIPALTEYEFQPYHPLPDLLLGEYVVSKEKNELIITIKIDDRTVKRHNNLVSDYYFEAILLYGNLAKPNGLRTESELSPLYSFQNKAKTICTLRLSLPSSKTSWAVLLKLSCHEGKQMAVHPKHYGMKVVKVGNGD